MAIDWNDCFNMSEWTETFGICLMFGIDEDVYKSNYQELFYEDEYQKIRLHIKQLKADAVHGVIPYIREGDEFYFNPRKLTEWAIFRGLPVPHELRKKLNNIKQISETVRLEMEKRERPANTLAIDWHDWLNRPMIWLEDALWLSMPFPMHPFPYGDPEKDIFNEEHDERRNIAETWINSGQLKHFINREEVERDYYIKPLDFFQLAKERGWIDLLNPLHDPINEFVERFEQKSGEVHIQLLTGIVEDSPKYLDAGWIAELWAAIPGEQYANKPFWQVRDEYRSQIECAVIDGKLEATTEENVKGFDDGFKEVTDKNRIRKIQDGWLGKNIVRFTISRDKLKEWLVKSNQWPIADDCLLANWFVDEPQAEALGDVGEGNQATKQRKKLKPLERETNEGLLLLYEIFKHYEVEYLDELQAIKAWGKIISKEFTSDLIKEISDAKKSITLSGGEKLGKIDFTDKYRKRFE